MTLSSVERGKSVNWDKIVDELAGVSAAHVVRIAQGAAKAAVLCGRRIVEQEYFDAAIAELKQAAS
jgi:ATP-dependent 26S proteasome regulatory subunit